MKLRTNGEEFSMDVFLDTDSEGGVTFTVDILTVVLLISSILYIFCLVLAHRKLNYLDRFSPGMSTKRLLILGVALVSAVRVMTILGVAAMNINNIRAHYSLQPSQHSSTNQNQTFYDDSMTVLFDLPNAIVVSTYALLTVVWAECFLESRSHTESLVKWKKRLLVAFMMFNTALYSTQLILYACIFFAPTVRTILETAVTGINFTVVVLVSFFYVYLNLRFSGFPFRSEQSKVSLSKVSSVVTLWSITRVGWGVSTLVLYERDVELLQDSQTPVWSMLLLLLFFGCEIIPMVAMLDYSYLPIIGRDRVLTEEIQPAPVSTGTGSPLRPALRSINILLSSPRDPPVAPRRVRWRDQIEEPLLEIL